VALMVRAGALPDAYSLSDMLSFSSILASYAPARAHARPVIGLCAPTAILGS
jgi:hypothetical protein